MKLVISVFASLERYGNGVEVQLFFLLGQAPAGSFRGHLVRFGSLLFPEQPSARKTDRTPVSIYSYRGAFSPIFRHFFRAIFQSSIFSCFFFPNIGRLTTLIFLFLDNFTNSDKTPPYIDTYLQLFPNFGNHGNSTLR